MVLRVYSAYRVCEEKVENAGVLTACHQQYRALVEAKHKIVSPRQAFLADLEHELWVWGREEKHECIVMLDANDEIKKERNFIILLTQWG